MGKATGVFLVLAGIGTAALVLPAVDTDAERQLADAVRIATDATRPATEPATASSAEFPSFDRPITTGSVSPRAIAPVHTPVAAAAARTDAGRVPVLIAPPQAVIRNAAATTARHTDAQARQGMTRDIQRELKRVGCYEGEISGEWNASTRQAMKIFIDRVNAALPIDEPDHILRTMVQGHPGHACGQACPAGQIAAQQGRCRPSGLVAQNSVPRIAEIRPHDAAPTLVMKDVPALRPAVPRPAWETNVAAASPQIAAPQIVRSGSLAGGIPPNLEGRMAMGVPPVSAGPMPAAVELAPTANAANRRSAVTPSGGVTAIIVPGAIAAYVGTVGSSAPPVPAAVGVGPRTPNPVKVTAARSAASANSGDNSGDRPAPQQREHPRPRPYHASPPPPPPKFKFQEPSYVGRSSSSVASYKRSASPFSHFFDKLLQSGR